MALRYSKPLYYFLISSITFFSSCSKEREILDDKDYFSLSEVEINSTAHATDGILLEDEGLDIQLFAAEPNITNPTNMDIDDKGRVWICEGYNYRNKLNPNNPYNKEGDRIVILEDTDQDGISDKTTVFYQGEDINAALGIAILGNKVIVSVSPYVYVFTDEDGDDKADKKEILFEGIGGEDHDHGIHAFVVGPDGKLYFNFGNKGNSILSRNGEILKDIYGREISNKGTHFKEGMVFRCDLNGENIEVLGHNFRNPYELTVDPFGTIWQSDNDDDGNRGVRINYVMEHGNFGFKDEITGEDWRVSRTNMEDSVYLKHWHLNDPGVVPNLLQTYQGSPTGILFYEGKLLPDIYQNQIIHADAGPSIVRSYTVSKSGAGFEATIKNLADGSKRNQKFRPSDICVGPDGSLFVADWYDSGVGGHNMIEPNQGRVFRIAPLGTPYKFEKPDYSTPGTAIIALFNANKATQFNAYQALLKMKQKATPALENLLEKGNNIEKAKAVWLLSKIDSKYVLKAFEDADEDIRITAIRASRELDLDFSEFYLKASLDKSDQVRREVALAIYKKDLPDIWVNLANQYKAGDRWYLEALGIAAEGNWDKYLEIWNATEDPNWISKENIKDIIWRSRSNKTTELLFSIIENAKGKEKFKFIRSLDFQSSPRKFDLIKNRIKESSDENEKIALIRSLPKEMASKDPIFEKYLIKTINSISNDVVFVELADKLDLKAFDNKIEELSFQSDNSEVYNKALNKLYNDKGISFFIKKFKSAKTEAESIKKIGRIGILDKNEITDFLISVFNSNTYSLGIKKEAMKAMNGWESEKVLWDLAKKDKINEDVLVEAKALLFGTWHSDIRAAANKKYNSDKNSNQFKISELLSEKGNVLKGKEVFDLYCISCHKLNGNGIDFGPGLSKIGSKLNNEGLYDAIINPNNGISFGYEGIELEMKNGSIQQGIMISKTEDQYQMKFMGSDNIVQIDRNSVKNFKELDSSIMPKFPLKKQELVDLVGYLETLK